MQYNIVDEFDRDGTPRGAVLVVDRVGYSHWGIYAGNGKVIQVPGGSEGFSTRGTFKINTVSLTKFKWDGATIYVCKVRAGESLFGGAMVS